MTHTTPSDLPVPPNTLGIVICSGRRTTESGEPPHVPTAPNIASAMPSTSGAAPTATAVDPPPRNVEDDGFVDPPLHDNEDDGFVVASAPKGMQTTSPRGAVVVERTPARMRTRYEMDFGGLTQLVLSGKAGDEESQPLLSPPAATNSSFPPLPPQQWGKGDDFRHPRNDCDVLLDKREEDRASIADCFKALFEKYTKDMDCLLDNMEAKDAAHQAQIQASFDKIVKLERELRSAPNVITTHLNEMVPQAITTVLDRTLPSTLTTALQDTISPTLKTVLDDTISDLFVSVMDGTFTDFTTKVELMGTDMVQAVRASVASVEGPLLECYAAVQEEYSACKTHLNDVLELLLTRTDLPALAPASHTPPANHGGDAMVPSRPPSLHHGGDAPYHALSADVDSMPVDAHGGDQRHPSLVDVRPPALGALAPGLSAVGASVSEGLPCLDGSCRMPVLPTWGHGFHLSAPAPLPSASMAHGLRVETAPADIPGGRIKTPRSTNPAQHTRNRKMNHFDLAGLANLAYHIGDFGVDLLTKEIISKCGYQLFHVDHPEDVLLCFQEIINIHRVVVQTWMSTWTYFLGPVVEYILE
jgi:hypothetical protein